MYYIIYKTTNNVNGKIYVGQHSTMNLNDGYVGSGDLILAAINKYGKRHFTREILEYCTQENINEKEIAWIHELNSTNRSHGYNISLGGNCVMRGRKHTAKTKQLISDLQKGEKHFNFGKHHSIETRKKISAANQGRVKSPETRKNISISLTGKSRPIEVRKKISNSMKGNLNPFHSKTHTEKAKDVNREKHLKFNYVLMSPAGDIYRTNNITQFSRENNLTKSKMSTLSINNSKKYKSWTLIAKTPTTDATYLI